MTHTAHTTGIIDVGGGFRAIFGAGVEDRCLEEDVGFDHCYGISAGSANLAWRTTSRNATSAISTTCMAR